MASSRTHGFSAVVAASLGALAITVVVVRSDDTTSSAEPPSAPPSATATSSTTPSSVAPGTLGAATTKRGAAVRATPSTDATVISRLRAGVLLPIADEREGFFSVLTPCEIRGWIASADVDVHPRAAGDPRSLRDTTIVIDPGHGGGLTGAVGPSGLAEKEPNADIARRLASRLGGSRVFLTLSGDFDAGLEYRAAIADALRSHVFLSIHNNTEPDGTS
ncbi:MAG: N-acetylmuramoyl-L-alanine amidase, partial [Actinomycetota bacterium]